MADLNIQFGAYERTGNASLAALNCYAEEYPGERGPRLELRARPGWATFASFGTGPSRGAAQSDGLFGDAAIIVRGTAVHTLSASGVVTTLSGTVAGDDVVDIDIGQNADDLSEAYIATGSKLYHVISGSVIEEAFPDASNNVGSTSVCFHRGFWFAVMAGTGQFYYKVPGDVTWLALAFATAEYKPDPLKFIRSRGDQFLLGGSKTCEVWNLSGGTPALVPSGGLNFDHGCRATATAVNVGGSLIYVDNNANVRKWDGGSPAVVSDPGLNEQIAACAASDLRAWGYTFGGRRYYVLGLGANATWVLALDGSGERWFKFSSLDYAYWRTHLGCSIGDIVLGVDRLTSAVYQLDGSRKDDAGSGFPVRICAMIDPSERAVPLTSMVLVADLGDSPRTGQGSDPIIRTRWSDDQGKTWSDWSEAGLGMTGAYTVAPRWNALGTIKAFMGRVIEFDASDPVSRVFKRVFGNVA